MNASPAVPTVSDAVMDDSTDTVYDKGTWQATLQRTATLLDRVGTDRKKATVLLWQGAQSGIEEWLPNSSDDVNGENLYSEVIGILGRARKGDASKIKTVALAAKNNGLVLTLYPNLSKAYAEARRLTQTIAAESAEDTAAEKAVEALAAETPNSASTPENAAKIVLSKGLDEAARVLLDALGGTNEQAHRALLRAISQEIAGRVKPKVSTVKAGPKAGATQAKAGAKTAKPKATAPAASAKPKAAPVDTAAAKPVATKPVAVKGKPVMKGRPVVVPAKAKTA